MAPEHLRLLRRRGIETVILAGADTHGIMRGKRMPIAELDRAAARGISLSEVIWALPVDELEPVAPPAGHAGWFPRSGYADVRAIPDLDTVRIVPWHDHAALVLRETPQSGLGKRPSQLVAVDERPSVYGVVAASRQEPFREGVRQTLRRYGLPVEACNASDDVGAHCVAMRRGERAAQAAAVADWETSRYLEAL